jgi:hypothetical protein
MNAPLHLCDRYAGVLFLLFARVMSVSFIGATSSLVTASHDGTARVWDGDTGRCLHVLAGHTGVPLPPLSLFDCCHCVPTLPRDAYTIRKDTVCVLSQAPYVLVHPGCIAACAGCFSSKPQLYPTVQPEAFPVMLVT